MTHNLYSISSIFVAVSCLSMTLFSLFRSKGREQDYVWVLFCLMATVWGGGGWGFSSTTDYRSAYYYWQVANLCTIFAPTFYTHFIFTLLGLKKPRFLFALYSSSAFFIALVFLYPKIFLGDLHLMFNQFYVVDWRANQNMLYLLFYIAYYWALLLYNFCLLVTYYFRAVDREREQVKYIIMGSMFGWIGGHGIFPAVFGFDIYPASNFLIGVYPLVITYAIVRYRLMDIRVAMSSAGIFLAVYSLTLGIPVWLYLKGLHFWALLSMGILATPAPFIYTWLQGRAEDQILLMQKSYQRVLRTASMGLNRLKTVEDILRLIVTICTKAILIENAAFYLFDGQKYILKTATGKGDGYPKEISGDSGLVSYLKISSSFIFGEIKHNGSHKNQTVELDAVVLEFIKENLASVAIAVKRDKSLIGILFLGKKSGGEHYSDEDLSVLDGVAEQTAMAIENAIHLETHKKSVEEEMQDRRLKDMGIMSANVCHQMCNRLNHVTWISVGLDMEMASDAGMSEKSKQECKKLIDELNQHVDNAVRMADALKTYSGSGKDKKSVDLKRVVSIAKVIADGKHKGYEYDFITNIEKDLRVFCNEASLQDVFMNAIDNAIDSMKLWKNHVQCPTDYKPRIEVRAHANDGFGIVDVADNGQGFLVSDMNRAFTPYFTTKGLDKGTGLGLHAMREIVRQNNGTIEIISENFKGATIRTKLPLLGDDAEERKG